METIKQSELIKRFKELETIIIKFHLNYFEAVSNSFDINFIDDCSDDTLQILAGFNKAKTVKLKRDIIKHYVNSTFEKLFLLSHKNNIFFDYCSYTVYEINFESRFLTHKNTYVDDTKIDFTKKEFENIAYNNSRLKSYLNQINNERLTGSKNKKIDFLTAVLKEKNIIPTNNRELITNLSNQNTVTFEQTPLTTHPQQTETMNEGEPEQKTPYKIALLHELGFFKLDAIKKLTKENQYKIISAITGGTHRTIKGNVLVLDPNSKENRITYTSNNHIDEVQNYLNKLK